MAFLHRTLKAATVKVYHYASAEALSTHLQAFSRVYPFTKRLETLKGLTSHGFACAERRKTPSIFYLQRIPGRCMVIAAGCRDATFCVSSLNDRKRAGSNNISNDETQNIASLLRILTWNPF